MIFYFYGTKERGLDLLEKLEEISYFRQAVDMQPKTKYKIILRNAGIDGWRKYINMVDTTKFVTPCDDAYEGEKEEYIYCLYKYKVGRVKNDSPEAFIIKNLGIEIKL